MKFSLPTSILAALFLIIAVSAAERKDASQVSMGAMLDETQQGAEPTDGINLVWYVPNEYWDVVLAQDSGVSDEERTETLRVLEDHFVLAVVRADIGMFGSMQFHDEVSVFKSFTATAIDAQGTRRKLERAESLSDEAELLMQSIKPALAQAMGPLGENFHMFVMDNRDANGQTIVSPLKQGQLEVVLEKLGNEQGGKVAFEFPLDSLFVPRECTKCSRPAHIRWNFCPFCGTELPK